MGLLPKNKDETTGRMNYVYVMWFRPPDDHFTQPKYFFPINNYDFNNLDTSIVLLLSQQFVLYMVYM